MRALLAAPVGDATIATRTAQDLTIVIPAYNEEERLPATLHSIREWLPGCEIVVVDDGSRDGTAAAAARAGARVISYQPNRGKGHALKVGMMAAAGGRVLFTDSDRSTSIDQIVKLEALLDAGCDVAVASRKMRGSLLIRRQPRLRETLGKGFTFLAQLAFGVHVHDFTCGFKMFTREAARAIFSQVTVDRWGFDVEVLYLASRMGFRIGEAPISWIDNRATKVRLWKDVGRSFLDLVQIRLNAFFGRYRGRRRV